MDAGTLRLILIILGAIIIGAIFMFGNPERKKKRQAARLARAREKRARKNRQGERREPTLGGSEADEAESDSTRAEPEQPDLVAEPTRPRDDFLSRDSSEKPVPRKESKVYKGPPPDKIVSLYLVTTGNDQTISGVRLLDAAIKAGLIFGDMEIFHRKQEGGEQPLFSMANLEKPGRFDRTAWNEFETRGLTLFMALPGPLDAIDTWESMHATGQRLATLLDAELRDAQQRPLNRERLGEMRDEMRDYDRQRAASRSL